MVSNITPVQIMIFNRFILIFHHFYNFSSDRNFVTIISIMLYIPKIDDYLKILTDDEVKDFFSFKFW